MDTAPADTAPADTAPADTPPATPSPQPDHPTPAAAPTSGAPPGPIDSDAASRIKERLTARQDHKPVESADGASPRPEVPRGSAVEIPDVDELEASLEEQISSALGDNVTGAAGPVETVPVPDSASDDSSAPAESEEIGPGSQLKGTVQQVHGDDVFIDAGVRGSVVVALKQFAEDKQPSVGDAVTVIVESGEDDGLIRARLPQGRSASGGNWDALAVGQVVDCMVTGTNKGGLQVSVSNLRGFMPASQVDTGYVDNLESFVGQKVTAQITEVNKKKKNLVLSRRILLQEEREGQRDEFWATLEAGQEHEGVVKTIKDYGAFINIGVMDGFLHIGEMSWSRINHPNEVLSEGQTIQVKILKKDEDKKRISLSMKQLIQNPWQSAAQRYAPESIITGTVTRIADFGAFVQLEPGIEGLVHISQLAWRRVGSVSEVLSMGETRDFQVIEVDTKRKRVSLSVKALEQRPQEPRHQETDSAPARRKANEDLRGGTSGTDGAGGLFGNPSDFT